MIRFLLLILLTISFLCPCSLLAEGVSGSQKPATTASEEEFEVAAAPIVIIAMGILRGAALIVQRGVVHRSFTEKAAKSAARSIRLNNMRRLRDSACYLVQAAGEARMILSSDKTTVIFAGSHEAYNKFIRSKNFTTNCRKGTA